MIFVHYEQRKVMLSQLHPTESGDPDLDTEPPSELKQVERRKNCDVSVLVQSSQISSSTNMRPIPDVGSW